jgi:hypothetical protein
MHITDNTRTRLPPSRLIVLLSFHRFIFSVSSEKKKREKRTLKTRKKKKGEIESRSLFQLKRKRGKTGEHRGTHCLILVEGKLCEEGCVSRPEHQQTHTHKHMPLSSTPSSLLFRQAATARESTGIDPSFRRAYHAKKKKMRAISEAGAHKTQHVSSTGIRICVLLCL